MPLNVGYKLLEINAATHKCSKMCWLFICVTGHLKQRKSHYPDRKVHNQKGYGDLRQESFNHCTRKSYLSNLLASCCDIIASVTARPHFRGVHPANEWEKQKWIPFHRLSDKQLFNQVQWDPQRGSTNAPRTYFKITFHFIHSTWKWLTCFIDNYKGHGWGGLAQGTPLISAAFESLCTSVFTFLAATQRIHI